MCDKRANEKREKERREMNLSEVERAAGMTPGMKAYLRWLGMVAQEMREAQHGTSGS